MKANTQPRAQGSGRLEFQHLLYTLGEFSRGPGFDLALEYHDARAFAQKLPPVIWWPWLFEHKAGSSVPFDTIINYLKMRELRSEQPSMQNVLELVGHIESWAEQPQTTKSHRILLAYEAFDERFSRIPTLIELRFAEWAIRVMAAPPPGFSEGNPALVLIQLKRAWEAEKAGYPTKIDPSEFRRLVGRMGLELLNASVLTKIKKHQQNLLIGADGASVGSLLSASRADLEQEKALPTDWDSLVDCIARWPLRSDAMRWNGPGYLALIARAHRYHLKKISPRVFSDAWTMLEGIRKLDVARSSYFLYSSVCSKQPRVEKFVHLIRRATEAHDGWPPFSALLNACDQAILESLTPELYFTPEEMSALLELRSQLHRPVDSAFSDPEGAARSCCGRFAEVFYPVCRDAKQNLGDFPAWFVPGEPRGTVDQAMKLVRIAGALERSSARTPHFGNWRSVAEEMFTPKSGGSEWRFCPSLGLVEEVADANDGVIAAPLQAAQKKRLSQPKVADTASRKCKGKAGGARQSGTPPPSKKNRPK